MVTEFFIAARSGTAPLTCFFIVAFDPYDT
jgi:hypothetical protein